MASRNSCLYLLLALKIQIMLGAKYQIPVGALTVNLDTRVGIVLGFAR